MRFKLFLFLAIVLVTCKKQTSNDAIQNVHSIHDYFADKDRIDKLQTISDCDSIISLLNTITTIDFLNIKEKRLRECGVDFSHPYNIRIYEQYPKVYQTLSEIMSHDQMIRDSLTNELAFKDNMNQQEYIAFKRSILKETDSLNAVKFDSLINSLGEWVGAKYRDIHLSSPRIEIFISHLDAEQYVKYTRMAYHSAQKGKEYWSRVMKLIGFAQKYILHDEHILKHNIYMIPFRFVEYTDEYYLDENSDLTILEFQNLSHNDVARNGNMKYELMSSYPDDEKRAILLKQAQSILMKQGLPQESITIDYIKDTLTSHTLSYKLKF